MDFTVIILAGGKSTRMGQNKALLPIGNDTEIAHLVKLAKKITKHIIVVTNEFQSFTTLNVKLVADLRKNMGPLAGIEAGLTATTTDLNLILACDMPFINVEIALEIMKYAESYDAVIPMINGQRHPLFAAYHKNCLPHVIKTLDEQDRKIVFLLDKLNTKWLTEHELHHADSNIFFNMNTVEEYQWAKKQFTETE